MSDMSEAWNEYKTAQQERRIQRLPIRKAEILSLRNLGHKVRQLTPFQYRIDEVIDVYPIHNRYHDLKTGKRGGYKSITEFIKRRR